MKTFLPHIMVLVMLLPVTSFSAPEKNASSAVSFQAAAPNFFRDQPGNTPAKGKFLVASRAMADPRFAGSVVLILQHNRAGTVGVVINRPADFGLSRLLPKARELQRAGEAVYLGGPVDQGSILFLLRTRGEPRDADRIVEDVWASSSLSLLIELLADRKAAFRTYLGHAEWVPGQLEAEIMRGSWHVLHADAKTIFERKPSDMWDSLIGISGSQWVRSFFRPETRTL